MTDPAPRPLDLKAHLAAADVIVDVLPWKLGITEPERKRSRGRVAALTHQIALLLATGWHADDIRTALTDDAPTAADAPNADAQERAWRKALKRARSARSQATPTA